MTESRPPRAVPVVAIDGPAGAGKSTVARRLADRLGYILIDTGALYRAVALAAIEEGVSLSNGPQLGELAGTLALHFERGDSGDLRLLIGDRDCSTDIRQPEISMAASSVSQHPEVRAALLGLQRRLGAKGGVVMEGRDIGTVVFPDAEFKFFVTASPEARALRRTSELKARGKPVSLDTTLSEIQARDRQDSSRPVAPLKPASDAQLVDTTSMTIDEVVGRLYEVVTKH